jgi:hypothetical protein
MRHLGNIILLSLAWILWVQYETAEVGKPTARSGWQAHSAYPSEGYEKCIEDAETLAQNDVTNFRKYGGTVDMKVLLGKKFTVDIELKNGGSMHNTYTCFPDTVKPQE